LARDLVVVDRVEEAPEARRVVVPVEVTAIDLRRDAPHARAVLVSRKEDPFGVLEERIFLGVQPVLELLVERANVRRIAGEDGVADVEELADLAAHRRLADFDHWARGVARRPQIVEENRYFFSAA